jgi:Malectin domain
MDRSAEIPIVGLIAFLALGCGFDQGGINEPGVRTIARDAGRDRTIAVRPPDATVNSDGPAMDTPPAAPDRPTGLPPDTAAAPDASPDLPAPPPDRPPPPDAAPDRPPPPPDAAPDTPPPVALRINVNGSAWRGLGHPGAWAADPGMGGVCGPNIYRNDSPIHGTDDDPLFQGEMFGNPLTCRVGGGTLPAGPYQVNLLFAEIFWGPGCPGAGGIGSRLFDIRIEGVLVAEDVDLFREAGCAASTLGVGRPIVKMFRTSITDGTLDLRFDVTTDNAKISAIELLSAW